MSVGSTQTGCSLDPTEFFPIELSTFIFGFLSPDELVAASKVSKVWNKLANDPLIWFRLLPKSLIDTLKSRPIIKEDIIRNYQDLNKIEPEIPLFIINELFGGSKNFRDISRPFFLEKDCDDKVSSIEDTDLESRLVPCNIPVVAGIDSKNCTFIQLNLVAKTSEDINSEQTYRMRLWMSSRTDGIKCVWRFNNKLGKIDDIQSSIVLEFPGNTEEAFNNSILGFISELLEGKEVNPSEYDVFDSPEVRCLSLFQV